MKKIILSFFALILAIPFIYAQTTFYGTTRITAPAETVINLKTETMYRIFARDDYDGDISHNITIDGNNWTVTVPATVTYRVTNSKGVETTKTVNIVSGSPIVIQRTLYTLSRTALEAIQTGGMFRGDNHDAQHIGVFMPVGSTLRIRRITSGATGTWTLTVHQGRVNKDLNLSLSGNGASSAWQTRSGTDGRGGIPLIRTPRTEDLNGQEAIIEVEISSGVTDLDYYHYGDGSTQDFLNKWKSSNHYALLGNSVVNIMVSWADRTNGRFTASEFANNIDALLEMYADVVELFNRMIGLDIDATDPIDKVIHTRYLVVPYKDGVGLAFYGGNYCGWSVGDEYGEVGSYLERHWVVFHEIGHGYEGFIRNKEVPMVEIKNNILATHYQMTYLNFRNADQRRRSWLWGNTDPSIHFTRLASRRNQGLEAWRGDYDDHFAVKLLFFMNLSNTAGYFNDAVEVMAELNRLNRRHAGKLSLADLYTASLNSVSNVNVIPFLESFGLKPSGLLKAQVFEEGSRIAQPFADLVTGNLFFPYIFPTDGRLLWGSLSLVKPDEFELGSGTATITINIDNLDLIKGQIIKIKDGDNIVRAIRIDSNTVHVAGLPAGAYYLDLPPTTSGNYLTDYNTLIINSGTGRGGHATMTVNYNQATVSPVAGLTHIELLGLSDRLVAKLSYDPVNATLTLESSGGQPHTMMPNPSAIYCSVRIPSRTFSKNYIGNENITASTDIFHNIQIGDEIEIFHAEGTWQGRPSRAIGVSSVTGESDNRFLFRSNQTETVVVTKYGLMMKNMSEAVQQQIYTENFNMLLNQFLIAICDDKIAGLHTYNDIKTTLIVGSEFLSTADKGTFDWYYGNKFRERQNDPLTVCEDCGNNPCICDEQDPANIRDCLKTHDRMPSLRVWITNHNLHIEGLTMGERYRIYNILGMLVYQGIAKSDLETVNMQALPQQRTYIIRSENKSVKIVW